VEVEVVVAGEGEGDGDKFSLVVLYNRLGILNSSLYITMIFISCMFG
jgi:hypothetical protein